MMMMPDGDDVAQSTLLLFRFQCVCRLDANANSVAQLESSTEPLLLLLLHAAPRTHPTAGDCAPRLAVTSSGFHRNISNLLRSRQDCNWRQRVENGTS